MGGCGPGIGADSGETFKARMAIKRTAQPGECARTMQFRSTAPLGDREQLPGRETPRISVRALLLAGPEGDEGLPFSDASWALDQHPGTEHRAAGQAGGSYGSPRIDRF